MENRTIRSTPLWRLIILVLTVAALAATVVSVAGGAGVGVLVALGVLDLLLLAGLWLFATVAVEVDAAENTFSVSMFGRTQTRSLDAPARVDVRWVNVGNLAQLRFRVTRPDEAPLPVATPILGDAPELARQLRGAMARNPDLPADDFTRDKLTTDGAIRRGL